MHVVFVVDSGWILKAAVSLSTLVLADEEDLMSALARPAPTLLPENDRESAVDLLLKTDVIIAPVVDGKGVLLGL